MDGENEQGIPPSRGNALNTSDMVWWKRSVRQVKRGPHSVVIL